METKKTFHPETKLLTEERDYEFFGLRLLEIRRYAYNDVGKLTEINHLDGSNVWISTRKYSYNLQNQCFLETFNHRDSDRRERSFYLYNSSGQLLKVLGELGSRHQYLHEFSYNPRGERVNGLKAKLIPDSDLEDKYKKLLPKENPKQIIIPNAMTDTPEEVFYGNLENEDINQIAKSAIQEFRNERFDKSEELLIELLDMIKGDVKQLSNSNDFGALGKALLVMLDLKISDDIDTQQLISSVGYFCLSKAVQNRKGDLTSIIDRLMLMKLGHESLVFTVRTALFSNASPFSIVADMAPLDARDAIYKMQIADLDLSPLLSEDIAVFKKWNGEFNDMIKQGFFQPDKTRESVVRSGKDCHDELFEYLENRIIQNGDIDF